MPIIKKLSPTMYGEYENGRKGYWAEDIVTEMMPSAYDTNKTNESKYGYYAEPIIKSLSPSMYGEYENGRKGYWAEDIVREMAPSMYDPEYDYNESNESQYGYYAMPIIKSLSPSMYGEYENGQLRDWKEDL